MRETTQMGVFQQLLKTHAVDGTLTIRAFTVLDRVFINPKTPTLYQELVTMIAIRVVPFPHIPEINIA